MKAQRLRDPASVARHAPWTRLAAITIVAGLSALGCPGTLDNPGDFAAPDGSGGSAGSAGSGGGDAGVVCGIDPSQVPQQIFKPTCGTASCHGAMASPPQGGLDLESPGVEGRLIDQEATCPGAPLRIDSNNPDNSFLMDKLLHKMPACGDQMPFGKTLPADQIACVRDWIELVLGGSGDAGTDATAD